MKEVVENYLHLVYEIPLRASACLINCFEVLLYGIMQSESASGLRCQGQSQYRASCYTAQYRGVLTKNLEGKQTEQK